MKSSNFKLLLVDDNPKNIQVLAAVLSEHGFDFEYAKNGKQALLWLEEEEFDLVLLDVMMPEMDGFETCNRIRVQEKFKDLPILFLTARTDVDSLLKGFQVGGQDYISKPFHADELLARCRTHLELKKRKEELKTLNNWLQKEILKQTKELEDANKRVLSASIQLDDMDEVKIEFLQIISHEIRTPLNHIVGFNSMLQEFDMDEDSSKYLGYINKSVERLEEFSYKALDVTQIRALGDKVLKKQELDIENFMQDFVADQDGLCSTNKIKTKIHSSGSMMTMIDSEFLQKALTEILGNSIKHSEANCIMEFILENLKDSIILTIKDSGTGFSQKALDRLFKPVSPGVMHIDKDNIGLGLYFTSLIMQAHGGKLTAGNNQHKGAWVQLSWPVN